MDKPTLDTGTVYDVCTGTARSSSVRKALQGLKETVVRAAAAYEFAAARQAQHTLNHLKHQPDGESAAKATNGSINEELKKTYVNRMVSGAGRGFYNKLRGSCRGLCALCGHGAADTLDHQLPKDSFPLLSVVPINLVPACSRCNHQKKEHAPTHAGDQTLHPYFDGDVHDHLWLFAQVTGSPKPSIIFHVDPPADMPPAFAARARHHFATLQLSELYNSQIGNELRSLGMGLARHPLPPAELREHLQEIAEIKTAVEGRNSWKAALYRGLVDSIWYLEGGWEEPWR
ncbi:HNH endonuclease [Streptomyces sp. NPDC017435]|uniref:HNH endonuclease n=1 Tax=Streptomyces sp. NPDC017435 TaxID=3364995 RepID=UPI00378F772C